MFYFMFKVNNKKVNSLTQFCLRSISNGFGATEFTEASLKRKLYNFLFNYNAINIKRITHSQVFNDKESHEIMLRLIRQMFIGPLHFSRSLVTKCVSLNNEPCTVRPTVTDLNSVELNYYLFMISLDKYSRICNSDHDLSVKICVPSKTKNINVIKVFNMITNRNQAKHY